MLTADAVAAERPHLREAADEPGRLPTPYLLFLGDVSDLRYAKTAIGLKDWAPERCVGEHAAPGGLSIGLPAMAPADAHAAGARSLLIGVANVGGVIPPAWIAPIVEAMEAGLDVVSGLHVRLGDVPQLRDAAARLGRRLFDVRVPPAEIPVGSGRKRTGMRLLTVGTDCALGKKYTALALARALKARGVDADFRATGQTGIMIAGSGMPMDAVVSDFEAGAAEMLSPDARPDHWDIIEGQGSLFQPAYAAVSLGLLHGSQPDVVVVCHEAGRTEILGHPGFPVPPIEDVIAMNLALGRLTNSAIRCGGVSINTASLSAAQADAMLASEADRLGLPVADPIRGGAAFDRLVDGCLRA